MRVVPKVASVWLFERGRTVDVAGVRMSSDAGTREYAGRLVAGGSIIPVPADLSPAAVGCVVHKSDFERLLAAPSRSRSAHFAVHHVDSKPAVPVWRHKKAAEQKLSTTRALITDRPVDDLQFGHWLGTIVPKRHARRSVTRSLLKRQMREALASHAGRLAPGMWLLRLRSPFLTAQFPSAASTTLRQTAWVELDQLLSKASC